MFKGIAINIDNIHKDIPNFPLTALILAVFVPAIFIAWLLISSNENLIATKLQYKDTREIISIKEEIKYLDEILTMSAMMVVYSGNNIWLERYNRNGQLMDQAIITAIDLAAVTNTNTNKLIISDINQKLVSIEKKAFELALAGQLDQAQKVFETLNYKTYKQQLDLKLTVMTNEVEERLRLLDDELRRNKQLDYVISLWGLAVTVAVIIYLAGTIQRWRNRLISTAQYIYQQEQSEKQRLEQDVQRRTEELSLANKLLETNLHQLKFTQNELVEAEKLSSISRLVTGVAHEVNTPLSIGITSNSFLKDNLKELTDKYNMGSLSKTDIEQFIQRSKKGIDLVEQNLARSAKLIVNFKNVSSDQFIQDKQLLILSNYIGKVTFTLSSLLKSKDVALEIINNDPQMITTFPGSWAQITTNLVENAIKHGFKNRAAANEIAIDIYNDDNFHYFSFRDNGQGMTKETQQKIFEPFFTTNRSNGGTGLGLFIVSNIVTHHLKGSIVCTSTIGQGTEFSIKVPNCMSDHSGQ